MLDTILGAGDIAGKKIKSVNSWHLYSGGKKGEKQITKQVWVSNKYNVEKMKKN